MKRKINLVGQSTLTVSLPSKWAKEHGLKKGDELDVLQEKNSLMLSIADIKKEGREVSMSVDGLDKYLLMRYVTVFYITNYNKITLTYSKSQIYDAKNDQYINIKNAITKLCDRFIGLELVSQTSTKSELACFFSSDTQDINTIEKRIYFLIKETIEEMMEAIKGNYADFHKTMYDHHDNIAKFIHYYLRKLDSSDKNEEEKKFLYALYTIIDKLVDKLRHLSEQIEKHKCSPKVQKYLKEIFDFLYELFTSLHKKEFKQELVEERYKLIKRIEKESFALNELKVLSEVRIFLDVINDFSHAIVAMNLGSLKPSQ